MAAAKDKALAWITGTGCSLTGLLTTAPCSGPTCVSCFGCLGVGAGLIIALLVKRFTADFHGSYKRHSR